jgi:hypothetical protein
MMEGIAPPVQGPPVAERCVSRVQEDLQGRGRTTSYDFFDGEGDFTAGKQTQTNCETFAPSPNKSISGDVYPSTVSGDVYPSTVFGDGTHQQKLFDWRYDPALTEDENYMAYEHQQSLHFKNN